MKHVSLEITPELWAAIEEARGDAPRNGWIERRLWTLKVIRDAALRRGVTNPDRPVDGRGLSWPLGS